MFRKPEKTEGFTEVIEIYFEVSGFNIVALQLRMVSDGLQWQCWGIEDLGEPLDL